MSILTFEGRQPSNDQVDVNADSVHSGWNYRLTSFVTFCTPYRIPAPESETEYDVECRAGAEADRRGGRCQPLEERVEARRRHDRARARETKERHHRVEVRLELGHVVRMGERHRDESGRRDAHERGQKTVGVRDDDGDVVAPVEPARAARAWSAAVTWSMRGW